MSVKQINKHTNECVRACVSSNMLPLAVALCYGGIDGEALSKPGVSSASAFNIKSQEKTNLAYSAGHGGIKAGDKPLRKPSLGMIRGGRSKIKSRLLLQFARSAIFRAKAAIILRSSSPRNISILC